MKESLHSLGRSESWGPGGKKEKDSERKGGRERKKKPVNLVPKITTKQR